MLAASNAQPEFKTPIWDYLGFLVDDQRIADGKARMASTTRSCAGPRRAMALNRYVIAAVWGVESDFGKDAGGYFLPHARRPWSAPATGGRPIGRAS